MYAAPLKVPKISPIAFYKRMQPLSKHYRLLVRTTYQIEPLSAFVKDSCNGCGMCVRQCKNNAIKMVDRRATVDPMLLHGGGTYVYILPTRRLF